MDTYQLDTSHWQVSKSEHQGFSNMELFKSYEKKQHQIFNLCQVAINVAPEHLQFIVCKVGIDFFHGIVEFRNLHVLIQILRHKTQNTKTEAKIGILIKESQWSRNSCRAFLESLWPKVIVHALEALGHAFHGAILFAHLFLNAKK